VINQHQLSQCQYQPQEQEQPQEQDKGKLVLGQVLVTAVRAAQAVVQEEGLLIDMSGLRKNGFRE
jgi:hypothetical protein